MAAAFVVGSPKGDLGHLGDLLPKRGLLKVTFLLKSLLSERNDDRDVVHTSGNYLYRKIINDFNIKSINPLFFPKRTSTPMTIRITI